jgi:hypothetical protein
MSIIVLSVAVIAATMSAMMLAVIIAGRPLGGGCAGGTHACGKSIECEGCPHARARPEAQPTEEARP